MKIALQLNLDAQRHDEVQWTLTANATYTASSAYRAQFSDLQKPFDTEHLWKAKAESKVILFAWTAMHEKALTADILDAKGWENNVVCPLCLEQAETNYHPTIDCQFAREVLTHICGWMNMAGLLMPEDAPRRVAEWFKQAAVSVDNTNRKKNCGAILYVWWNVWKERNRRIFQGQEKNALHVAMLTKEEIDAFNWAMSSTTPAMDIM